MDVSSHRLWSELAPWPSVIQRLGRLNRDGKDQKARAFFWKIPKAWRGKQERIGPYDSPDIDLAGKLVDALISFSTANSSWQALQSHHDIHRADIEEALQPKPTPLPRAIDVHGLFFDRARRAWRIYRHQSISLRGTDPDSDVTVFWRNWSGKQPSPSNEIDGPDLDLRQEGCSVAVSKVSRLLMSRHTAAWLWDGKKACWNRVRPTDLKPGMVVMLHRDVGGYRPDTGWTGNASDKLDHLPAPGRGAGFRDDALTEIGYWSTLETHLADARAEAVKLCHALDFKPDDPCRVAVIKGAALHDLGKAHPKWNDALPAKSSFPNTLIAKCPRVLAIDLPENSANQSDEIAKLRANAVRLPDEVRRRGKTDVVRQKWAIEKKLSQDELEQLKQLTKALWAGHVPFRPGMRHEAASALAMWQRYHHADGEKPFPALAVYLAAAHHGKVRTVMRSLGDDGTDVFGIPRVPADLKFGAQSWAMDFSVAKDGASGEWYGNEFLLTDHGWTGLIADLLGAWNPTDNTSAGVVPDDEPRQLGPFAMAYLEALVCIADWRASGHPSQSTKPGEEPQS